MLFTPITAPYLTTFWHRVHTEGPLNEKTVTIATQLQGRSPDNRNITNSKTARNVAKNNV